MIRRKPGHKCLIDLCRITSYRKAVFLLFTESEKSYIVLGFSYAIVNLAASQSLYRDHGPGYAGIHT